MKRFPIYRALLALLVVPPFTMLVYFLIGSVSHPLEPGELRSLVLACLIFALPGYIVFLGLGLPTIYVLFDLRKTGFGTFAFFGMVYTSLPWVFIALHE